MIALFYSDVHTPKEKEKPYIIYSNNTYKMFWDVFISFLLLFVCFVIPLRLSLNMDNKTDENGTLLKGSELDDAGLNGWEITMYVCDGFFLIDLVASFFTTIEDREKMQEVADMKRIAKDYLSGWFWVDSLSIIPFDRII